MESNKALETTIAKGIVKASVWLFIANMLVFGIILSMTPKKDNSTNQ